MIQTRPSNTVDDDIPCGLANKISRAFSAEPFLERHGFRVPEIDLDFSVTSSREGSVQVLESHPRTFSVPSIDLETESEDENEDEDEDEDDDDDEIEIMSSIPDEDENTESTATTPEHGALEKDVGSEIIVDDGAEDRPAEAGVRGLNLKGPRLEDILSKPTALGTSQLNPIDLEGASTNRYDISDTESEDDGPEILPILQKLSKNDEKTGWSEPKLARPQYRMPTVDDDAEDQDAETLVTRILDTEAGNTKDKEFTRSESPSLPLESVAGATDGFDTEDDDDFSQDDDFSDYCDREQSESKAQSSNTGQIDAMSSPPLLFPFPGAAMHPRVHPSPVHPKAASNADNIPAQPSGPGVSMSEPIDVSQPHHENLTVLPAPLYAPLSAIQRAPSPSDAALVRKASDPKLKHVQTNHEQRKRAIVPEILAFPPERLYAAPIGSSPYKAFTQELMGCPEAQKDWFGRPYDQGPFSRRDEATIPQRQSAWTVAAEDDPQTVDSWGLDNGTGWVPLLNDHRSASDLAPRKENEGQSSKINISSLINTYYAEHPHTCKRKADDISSSNESEEAFFGTASTQPGTNHTQASTQPPPPSPYAAQSDANDTHLPDAQPRDSLPQADDALMTQDSVVEPKNTSSTSSIVTTKVVKTEGPTRKKARLSTSTSGGIGKFVSGVAVGLVGAFAAFVATIPASVREEALREMVTGA